MNEFSFLVSEDFEDERIDKYLAEIIPEFTRSFIQKQIDEKLLTVNDKVVKANYRLKVNDNIYFSCPDMVVPDILPENIPIDIVYEDNDVAIVNKPQGMVVHPGAGHYTGTLVNALMYHLDGRLSGINGVLRPGIVHRIDKDTSGLLIICKNDIAHNNIAEQLKEHTAERTYRAIVHGDLKDDSGQINASMGRDTKNRLKMAVVPGGKRAVTNYKVLERFGKYTYIECKLETGRTHQIRVHMAYIGHPLMGDPLYSTFNEPVKCEGQILHAKTIGFKSPTTGEWVRLDSEMPEYFEKILKYLRIGWHKNIMLTN